MPYDSGLAMVRHTAAHRAAMSFKASYLQRGPDEERVGMDWVPESSRRVRVVPIYALIQTLGRDGIAAAIQADGTCWAGGTNWQGNQAMRISISNWSTTEADIERSADAMVRCYEAVKAS